MRIFWENDVNRIFLWRAVISTCFSNVGNFATLQCYCLLILLFLFFLPIVDPDPAGFLSLGTVDILG